MAIDDTPSSFFAPWPDRLRHAAIILVTAGLALTVLVTLGELPPVPACAVFALIAAAALVPWRHDPATSPDDVRTADPIEAAAVNAIVAGMPDPAVLLDRAGRVIHLNAAAAQLGPALRKNELAQFALRSPEIVTALREAIATAVPRRATYLDQVPVDRWMELVITPVSVPTRFGGADKCMLMTFHDLTPLRRVEEMRADFVANASHELRTPLAALSGFIDTLQGPAKEDPAARERFLAIMQVQANRMARLIDDLLSLSRIELNAHLRPDKEVDLVAIMRQVADGLQTLARDRDVEVKTAAPGGPLTVLGDRDELIRVFENLVENALKYAASGKQVDIRLALGQAVDGKPEAPVPVRYYGPGIAPEHLPRLTERFYRVDVSESRAQGGTGLGLALVKHILNRHGGRLTIESVLGQGATFTAHLPAAEAAAGGGS